MPQDIRRGLIIVNTGPGKGKTTAAMGTALRAVGQGMRVLMLQFLKGSWHYGELDAVKAFGENFIMKQMGRGFVKVGGAETDPEDIKLVEQAGFHKGYNRGRVGISRKHALAIVNRGGAKAADIVALKNEVQTKVREVWDLELEPEPVFVGFDKT